MFLFVPSWIWLVLLGMLFALMGVVASLRPAQWLATAPPHVRVLYLLVFISLAVVLLLQGLRISHSSPGIVGFAASAQPAVMLIFAVVAMLNFLALAFRPR